MFGTKLENQKHKEHVCISTNCPYIAPFCGDEILTQENAFYVYYSYGLHTSICRY
jgi:hypothetical protein